MLVFSLQSKSVQTYLAQKTAKYLSEELQTRIEIESLYIKPFKSLVLEGLFIQDREKDTLLYTQKFTVDLNVLSLELRKISVNTVQMDKGTFFLKQYKDSTTNVEFIVNYFNTGTPKPLAKKRKPFDVSFDKITLNNIAFKYKNFNAATRKGNSIDPNDLELYNLNATILGLDNKTHLAKAQLRNLTFREKSGFYLKKLSTDFTIDTNRMEFKNLLLQTPRSRLSDYALFTFGGFKDFGQFFNKVYVKAHLDNSSLHPADLVFFSPAIKSADMDIRMDGDISGYLNNIKARNFALRAGKATYLRGNFDIKGLPRPEETFLSLEFDQVFTNKQDADYIIKMLTGKTGQVPTIVQKFGNIYFKGQFIGFPKDFIAHGEFKTSLGRIVSDINMKIDGKRPVYSGTVKAYDFNIGELLNQKLIGRTSVSASIKGSGFDKKDIRETIAGTISYLDFKDYRYTNINLNGNFNRNLFNGAIKVNDKNIKLDFNGSVNLNPMVPEFNFLATIREANLHSLNFIKDTVQVDADFNTNFSGKNLDDIQGRLDLGHIRLTNTKTSVVVDSVKLFAEGTGNERSLTINSDILDASIKGRYDLQTLPDYFISVAKRYIPSVQIAYKTPKPQNFDLRLRLKYFEPIGLFFSPDLKIPEGAAINGKFVSSENIATLSGFSKLVQYKNIKVNDLIIDETNDSKGLNVFITSDRVDLTDSLYIKNVNISNIIQNDSLALNIKLSDKSAINQLDLNGLVEFGVDRTLRLSLLPSDVIINSEVWKVQEQVHFKFDKGKTIIENFELFRDNQLLTINGTISADPEDKLDLDFKKFKLTTFNALTKGAGFDMKGELNGQVRVASIGKTPHIEASVGIDSIVLNNIAVGSLSLKTDLNNATKVVNVDLEMTKDSKETLSLLGTYDADSEDNNLDMAVKMDNSDLIIFQPFLKRLVSNLKGSLSANLKLSGKLLAPQVNGKVAFNDAGMTVNYLKTTYRITDSVRIENSVIILENLGLNDSQRTPATAIVNGTVDLHNIKTPDIHIKIVTSRPFMALNTTRKDNSIYYGTAYAIGQFDFDGPTNNMNINIDASTGAGTVFNIPLNSSEVIAENDFINFVSRDSSLTPKKTPSFQGLTMNFNLNIDENSEVNLFTDLGKLSGRGTATPLRMTISSLGDFAMYGNYIISEGKFLFTSQDIINKSFKIREGGSIRWTGNPVEAKINLNAVYGVRTSLSPLYSAAGRPPSNDRVQAEAAMLLTGELLSPGFALDLNFPADSYVKDELQSYLSDQNNLTLQSFNLIVRNRFAGASNDSNLQEQSLDYVRSAGTEFAFSQFNTILAQSLNIDFVDFNIRSFNDANLSFRLFNDRFIFTGGVTDQRKGDLSEFRVFGNNIASDVEAQFLIRKDGSLIARASNRPNNKNLLNLSSSAENINSIGLVSRQEFDTFGEFIGILTGKGRRDEKRKQQPATPVPPTGTPTSSQQKSDPE